MFRHAFFQSTTVGLKFYTLKALLLGEKGPSTSIIGVSFFLSFCGIQLEPTQNLCRLQQLCSYTVTFSWAAQFLKSTFPIQHKAQTLLNAKLPEPLLCMIQNALSISLHSNSPNSSG